jgi:hypothetical protein
MEVDKLPRRVGDGEIERACAVQAQSPGEVPCGVEREWLTIEGDLPTCLSIADGAAHDRRSVEDGHRAKRQQLWAGRQSAGNDRERGRDRADQGAGTGFPS